jgi:ribosomal protein L11 methyltransferase
MTFVQFEFPVDVRLAEDLSSFLEEEALSTSWYEGSPDSWIFQAMSSSDELRDKINTFFKEKGLSIPTMTQQTIVDKDWVSAVYRDFPPLTIGRFYIYGSHIQEPPPADCIPLCIEAATAFGSGQHESTEGCLRALTLLHEQEHFKTPLDMGCGSGILALAMAALWKISVVACDNDPEAVRVTLENGRQNLIDHLLQARVSDGFSSVRGETFDLITANILAGPLCQMAEDAALALTPNGVIILSGLLSRQAEEVMTAYEKAGLKNEDRIVIGEWTTLIMRKV